MDSGIVQQMRAEEADLMRKLDAVRAFLAAYGEPAASSTKQAPPKKPGGGSRGKVGLDGFGEYGRATVIEAMKFISKHDHPVITRRIVEAMTARGYEIRGNDPVNALSALLARCADVISHGRSGWTLADPESFKRTLGDAQNENEAPNGSAAGASETRGWGAPPPSPHIANPTSWPGA